MPHEEWINTATGEVADGRLVIRRVRFPREAEFVAMFQDGFEYLATLRLTPTQTAVLFKLLAKLDYENWIAISHETLAQELGFHRADVTKAVAGLVKHDVIETNRDPSDKRRLRYRLSLSLGWKGKAEGWLRAVNRRTDNVVPLPGVVLPKRRSKAVTPAEPSDHDAFEAAGQTSML